MRNWPTRIVLLAAAALTACEGASLVDGTGADTGGGGTGTPAPTVVTMNLTTGLATLSSGGSTGLTVTFVDQNGVPFTGDASVTFSSACLSAGTAQVTTTTAQPTNGGTIQATYTDLGCGQLDTITASSSANQQTLADSAAINVLPASVGSIVFVSATPQVIGIRGGGSGLPEQSQLVFQLSTTAGGPAAGRTVTFTLNNTAGGISFSNGSITTTSTTAADGTVGIIVRAGTVLTSVRVTATFTPTSGPEISTQSSALVVSTGLADQDSFSLSVTPASNVRGFDFDGTQVTVTLRVSDRNNNPVPEGTAIAFRTEGGDIVSQCFTSTLGLCSVTWESQDPRPAAHDPACTNGTDAACAGGLRAGRSTILATVEGEETFTDLNANGVFDDGDTFTDLGEAFFDKNENGVRDAAFEEYVEFNGVAGFQAAGDGKYNGLQCQHSTLCSDNKTVTVRDSTVIVMSGDLPEIDANDIRVNGSVASFVAFSGPGDFVQFCAVVRDARDQPMEADTTVSISTTLGTVESAASDDILNTIDDTAAANESCFLLKGPDGTDPSAGSVKLEVSTPSDFTQTLAFPATYTP